MLMLMQFMKRMLCHAVLMLCYAMLCQCYAMSALCYCYTMLYSEMLLRHAKAERVSMRMLVVMHMLVIMKVYCDMFELNQTLDNR